jgi:hypothetical protein
MLALRSSIAAHPASPKLTDIAVRTSTTRARKRVVILTVGPGASSLVCRRGGARVAPYGCGAVNTDLAQAIVPCGDQLDAHGVAPDHQPIAVMLDLVNPVGARGRLGGGGREAGLDEGSTRMQPI